jgi:hypothetical protein
MALGNTSSDKQLRGINLKKVRAKQLCDQALNAKEFAVAAGISYSTAREWFHLPGFPVIRGVVFWQDFVRWRASRQPLFSEPPTEKISAKSTADPHLPMRAAQIFIDAT